MYNSTDILNGTTPYTLASSGFVNPSYIGSDSTGLDISVAGTVVISFEGTYTGATLLHQQTLDPTGQSGWYSVAGVPLGVAGSAVSSASTSGVGYLFPATGYRHRIQATALASGTLVCRVCITSEALFEGVSGGSSGGAQAVISTALTVTASSAYATGNVVGGLMTLSNAVRFSGGTGYLNRATLQCKSNQTGQYDLVLFSANPTNSTFTDKTALAVNTADWSKVIGVAHITDWTSLGTPSVGQLQQAGISLYAQGSQTLYAVLVTRTTPTFASTSDLTVELEFQQD